MELVERHGPPTQVLWLTLGNSSNTRVKQVLSTLWPRIQQLLQAGERLIEIRELS